MLFSCQTGLGFGQAAGDDHLLDMGRLQDGLEIVDGFLRHAAAAGEDINCGISPLRISMDGNMALESRSRPVKPWGKNLWASSAKMVILALRAA